MMTNASTYITTGNVHGKCDLCSMDGSINEVIGGHYLCRGCIDNVDSVADGLVYGGEFDEMEEAFKHVVKENVGSTIVLHYPTGDSPSGGHTHTVENVESFELEFGDENTVCVRLSGGEDDEFTATALTVSGMSP